MLNSNLAKKHHWTIKKRPQGMSSKIFATKYQKAARREKYSNVLQTHIVIVGQVRNISFFLKL